MEKFYFDVLPSHPQPQPLESFTSYISRLSEANGLRTVEEVAQLLFLGASVPSNGIMNLMDFPLTSFGVLPVVSVCSEKRLQKTTFFHLTRKFGRSFQKRHLSNFFRNTTALNLRYCPYCLIRQPVPYYSLLWRFLHLADCPYHGYALLDRCMHCGSSVPLFAIPSKIPFCMSCKKDLRECRSLKASTKKEHKLSVEELEFLLSPEKCEEEEDIPFLLSERLTYKAKLKSMTIVHPTIGELPRRIIKEWSDEEKEEIRKRRQDEQKIRSGSAGFINYLNYTRFLGITFNDLFEREFFTALPSDTDEQNKQSFLMLERQWKL